MQSVTPFPNCIQNLADLSESQDRVLVGLLCGKIPIFRRFHGELCCAVFARVHWNGKSGLVGSHQSKWFCVHFVQINDDDDDDDDDDVSANLCPKTHSRYVIIIRHPFAFHCSEVRNPRTFYMERSPYRRVQY